MGTLPRLRAPSDSALVDVTGVVRNVISARVRDRHLVEDLTQETLVRVSSARSRLGDDSLQAYAIVTARNVVVSHARGIDVRDRHAHRLVDHPDADGPEQEALTREEHDALAGALKRLDPAERELLLRYETADVDIATLADDHSTSPGSIAMRLSRARAVLRLEFILAFRRVELPTARCRAVLLALSAGDTRRQRRLDAAAHLLRCATCSQLAQPVAERRRSIAAWLIVPFAEVLRRALRALRDNRTVQAATAAAVATVVAAGILVIANNNGGPDSTSVDGNEAEAPAPAATAASAVPARAARPEPPANTAGNGSAAVAEDEGGPVVPAPVAVPTAPPPATTAVTSCEGTATLETGDPSSMSGCPFESTTVVAVDVPVDEGFWAELGDGRIVWVHLIGTGESPADIDDGATVTLSGVVHALPPDGPMPGLAIDEPLLGESGWYLEVRFEALRAP